MKRETAWRVFAGEYNDSTLEIKDDGEKTPSYIVTPLGGMVNRVFITGVLTDVENISESGDLIRAHISDPTGVFTIYSGQYQPEAKKALMDVDVPAFVAVVGKSRTYIPEEGTLFVSIRPELVREVDSKTRDEWILETCKSMKDRIEAIKEAKRMNQANAYDLRKLGYSRDLAEGVISALKHYEDIAIDKYITLINESIQYLSPMNDTLPDINGGQKDIKEDTIADEKSIETSKIDEKKEQKTKIDKSKKVEKQDDNENSEDFEEKENIVLDVIKQVEGEEGAPWDEITGKCEKKGIDKDTIEEVLTSLMDKGLIYEPVLGTIKTT